VIDIDVACNSPAGDDPKEVIVRSDVVSHDAARKYPESGKSNPHPLHYVAGFGKSTVQTEQMKESALHVL
jgi:hypothetical protein